MDACMHACVRSIPARCLFLLSQFISLIQGTSNFVIVALSHNMDTPECEYTVLHCGAPPSKKRHIAETTEDTSAEGVPRGSCEIDTSPAGTTASPLAQNRSSDRPCDNYEPSHMPQAVLYHVCKHLGSERGCTLLASLLISCKVWRATVQSAVEQLVMGNVSQVSKQ